MSSIQRPAITCPDWPKKVVSDWVVLATVVVGILSWACACWKLIALPAQTVENHAIILGATASLQEVSCDAKQHAPRGLVHLSGCLLRYPAEAKDALYPGFTDVLPWGTGQRVAWSRMRILRRHEEDWQETMDAQHEVMERVTSDLQLGPFVLSEKLVRSLPASEVKLHPPAWQRMGLPQPMHSPSRSWALNTSSMSLNEDCNCLESFDEKTRVYIEFAEPHFLSVIGHSEPGHTTEDTAVLGRWHRVGKAGKASSLGLFAEGPRSAQKMLEGNAKEATPTPVSEILALSAVSILGAWLFLWPSTVLDCLSEFKQVFHRYQVDSEVAYGAECGELDLSRLLRTAVLAGLFGGISSLLAHVFGLALAAYGLQEQAAAVIILLLTVIVIGLLLAGVGDAIQARLDQHDLLSAVEEGAPDTASLRHSRLRQPSAGEGPLYQQLQPEERGQLPLLHSIPPSRALSGSSEAQIPGLVGPSRPTNPASRQAGREAIRQRDSPPMMFRRQPLPASPKSVLSASSKDLNSESIDNNATARFGSNLSTALETLKASTDGEERCSLSPHRQARQAPISQEMIEQTPTSQEMVEHTPSPRTGLPEYWSQLYTKFQPKKSVGSGEQDQLMLPQTCPPEYWSGLHALFPPSKVQLKLVSTALSELSGPSELPKSCPPGYWQSLYAQFPGAGSPSSAIADSPSKAKMIADDAGEPDAESPEKLSTAPASPSMFTTFFEYILGAASEPEPSTETLPKMCPPEYWERLYAKFPAPHRHPEEMISTLEVLPKSCPPEYWAALHRKFATP